MPETTNIRAVKTLAKHLVYLDFEMTKFSPILIHHPYTDSSLVAFQENGKCQMINLLEDDVGLKKWQKFLIQTIDSDETAWDIYRKITKPYALSFIQLTERYLSPKDLGEILRDAWTRIEFVSSNPVFTQAQFVKLFRKCDKRILMTDEERNNYDALPEKIEIYRGVRKGSKKVKGMSWTTDFKVAEWFSKRFTDQHDRGDVYKAIIRKSDVLAYFQSTNEREIVVDTKGLRELERIPNGSIPVQSRKPPLSAMIKASTAQKRDQSSVKSHITGEVPEL